MAFKETIRPTSGNALDAEPASGVERYLAWHIALSSVREYHVAVDGQAVASLIKGSGSWERFTGMA
jgi:hypothetical protein